MNDILPEFLYYNINLHRYFADVVNRPGPVHEIKTKPKRAGSEIKTKPEPFLVAHGREKSEDAMADPPLSHRLRTLEVITPFFPILVLSDGSILHFVIMHLLLFWFYFF